MPLIHATALQLWRLVECTSRSVVATIFTCGCFFDDLVDHAEERAGIELGLGRDFRPGNAEALLQVFFVADQHVDVLHDAVQHCDGALLAARDVPELGAVVQVERGDRARGLGGLHAFDDHFGGGRRERREDAAASGTSARRRAKIAFQSKSPGLSCAAASLQRL